jgi:GH25 family lysozyme M1 (1,4-beta-N-acetylmuramidase)
MAKIGPDISEWQGNIDILEVAKHCDFFIFRSHAGRSEDKKAARNVDLAIDAGKPYGLYIYSYALGTSRAVEEAQRVIDFANSRRVKPKFLVIDMEDADGYKSRNGFPSDQTLRDICTVECEAFERAGYYAMVYASSSWFNGHLAGIEQRFDKWEAHWPVSGGRQKGMDTDP